MTTQEVNLPSGDNIHKLELREPLVSKDVLIVMRNRIGPRSLSHAAQRHLTVIHLPALLGTGVTPRPGRFGLGRRCLRVLDARNLPCISGPGLCRIGSAQRHILFGHCAKVENHQGRSEMAACRPVVGKCQKVLGDGESGVTPPNCSAWGWLFGHTPLSGARPRSWNYVFLFLQLEFGL